MVIVGSTPLASANWSPRPFWPRRASSAWATSPGAYLVYAPPPPPLGYYECRPERVCIPGYWSTESEPPVYGWVRHGCHAEYVMIRPACTHRVWVPERYEVRETRVWVPGGYVCRR